MSASPSSPQSLGHSNSSIPLLRSDSDSASSDFVVHPLQRKQSRVPVINIHPKAILTGKSFHLLFSILLAVVFSLVYYAGYSSRNHPDSCFQLTGLQWQLIGLHVSTSHSLRLGSLVLGVLSIANSWVAFSPEPYRILCLTNFLNLFSVVFFGMEAMIFHTISLSFFLAFWVILTIVAMTRIKWKQTKTE